MPDRVTSTRSPASRAEEVPAAARLSAEAITSSTFTLSAFTRAPTSRLASLGAPFSQTSFTWVRIPFLRAIHRSRNILKSESLVTFAASDSSAANSSATVRSSASAEKSVNWGTVYMNGNATRLTTNHHQPSTKKDGAPHLPGFGRCGNSAGEEPTTNNQQQKSVANVATLFGIRWLYAAFASAAFACDVRLLNAAASFTAMSARILRSNSTPAFFKPLMKWL